jgi:RNA polymerase sigma-70 factor (ECF subfamily)
VPSDAIERAEELIDSEEVRRQVAGALGRLNKDLRQAVVERVINGRSYTDAARLTGCSEQLLRKRVSRGLKILADDLEILREDHDRGL